MDTYGHLFPNGNRDTLDEVPSNNQYVPGPHPQLVSPAVGRHKLLENMVAVPRIERTIPTVPIAWWAIPLQQRL